MKELIAFLLLWIGAETNYNVNLDAPRIIQLTQQELNTLYYKEDQRRDGTSSNYQRPDPNEDTNTPLIYV